MYEQESRGLGKALCHVCGEPCRDHENIGPCPKLGVALLRGTFPAQQTERTAYRQGRTNLGVSRRSAIVQARIKTKLDARRLYS